MARPHLHDDGWTVTLDLHGATVDEALRLTEAAVIESARRGRTSLRVVHGSSTTDPLGGTRTIKSELYAALDAGGWSSHVTSVYRGEGLALLGLAPAPNPARGPVSLSSLS